jgi:hypothetical protein
MPVELILNPLVVSQEVQLVIEVQVLQTGIQAKQFGDER